MIWNVADGLVGPFKPHEYGTVILPMTVIKRFHDCLLPTRDADMEHTPAEVVCGNASKFQPVSFDTQIGPDGDISFSVIGESGCGKSTSVKQMLSHYPQVLEIDLGDEGTFIQICWINVQAPLNGNLQELYIAIGHEIDKERKHDSRKRHCDKPQRRNKA